MYVDFSVKFFAAGETTSKYTEMCVALQRVWNRKADGEDEQKKKRNNIWKTWKLVPKSMHVFNTTIK